MGGEFTERLHEETNPYKAMKHVSKTLPLFLPSRCKCGWLMNSEIVTLQYVLELLN